MCIEKLINLLREEMGISKRKEITELTMLEDDLGITGDDGDDLFEAIDEKFNIALSAEFRKDFKLKDNEYLFHGEGFDIFGGLARLFGKSNEKIKPISVGDLYEAIKLLQNEKYT